MWVLFPSDKACIVFLQIKVKNVSQPNQWPRGTIKIAEYILTTSRHCSVVDDHALVYEHDFKLCSV